MVSVGGMMNGEWCLLVIAVPILLLGGIGVVEAQQVHHVIGGDRGWDSSSDIQAWSSEKAFRVGDNIWFAYSSAEEIIAELKSKEEFDTCDVSNPIKMYTDGLNRVTLDGEGSRYFTSGRPETCKNGLKLHLKVLPSQPQPQPPATESVNKPVISTSTSSTVMATGPTTPSSASKLGVGLISFTLIWVLLTSVLTGPLGF